MLKSNKPGIYMRPIELKLAAPEAHALAQLLHHGVMKTGIEFAFFAGVINAKLHEAITTSQAALPPTPPPAQPPAPPVQPVQPPDSVDPLAAANVNSPPHTVN